MSIHIGYACLTVGEPGMQMTGCRLKNASVQKLRDLTASNLIALDRILDYNIASGIRLFRISSDVIPFGSHPLAAFDWKTEFEGELRRIGKKIKDAGLRVSMHPGQYTVLNSPRSEVAAAAVLDLAYHTDFLDALEVGGNCRIVLHAGGEYGNKTKASADFIYNARKLPEKIRSRIAIENDDRSFTVEDVLHISKRTGFPVVFDNLHNSLNPAETILSEREWIEMCALTWSEKDGCPKVHYSQAGERRGAHAKTICTKRFLEFFESLAGLDVDIMLEVKDKNCSAVKCAAAVSGTVPVHMLEEEWARYKYLVLSRSAKAYTDIRNFLKNKGTADAVTFYTLIDDARILPPNRGAQVNAAQHVWGYFKKTADEKEKKRFEMLITAPDFDEPAIKRFLLGCARKYGQPFLLKSYYFYLD